MPWKECSPMDERVKFIAAALDGDVSMSSLCLAYGISRKTGYKWVARYEEKGPEGLKDLSNRPHHLPHRVSFGLERLLVQHRKRHPNWGPKKIISSLQLKDPKLELPAASTVGAIFQRRGLVKKQRVRPRPPQPKAPIVCADRPNAVWGADFKGDFKVLDGRRCYPLTISDLCSRFLLHCQGQEQKTYQETRRGFELAFQEFGLPDAILSDNGSPFSSPSGFSQLSIWWIRLGIKIVRIQPGKPQQNGIHERMHRTLKEAIYPTKASMRAQQRSFDRFVQEFNFERPHEALGQNPPASVYQTSSRPYPKRLPPLEYPAHFEVRKVDSSGRIGFHDRAIFVSEALSGQYVGLECIDDGLWLTHFGGAVFGRLDESREKLERNNFSL